MHCSCTIELLLTLRIFFAKLLTCKLTAYGLNQFFVNVFVILQFTAGVKNVLKIWKHHCKWKTKAGKTVSVSRKVWGVSVCNPVVENALSPERWPTTHSDFMSFQLIKPTPTGLFVTARLCQTRKARCSYQTSAFRQLSSSRSNIAQHS